MKFHTLEDGQLGALLDASVVDIGSAARAPVSRSPRVAEALSYPTQTPATRLGLNPRNQAST